MFLLRVHSVDADHPLDPQTIFRSHSQSNNPKFSERRGALHLFRTSPRSSLPTQTSPSTLLFILAVPNYLSFHDFIPFCGPHLDNFYHLLFIRFPSFPLSPSPFVQNLTNHSFSSFMQERRDGRSL